MLDREEGDRAEGDRAEVDGRREPMSMSDIVADYLQHRSAICARCGYNLQGLTTDRCPECSHVIELYVKGPPRNLWPLALAVSPGLFLGAVTIVALLFGVYWGEIGAALFVGLILGVSCAAACVIVVNGHAFLERRVREQWGIVALIWGLHAAPVLFLLVLA